jgi:hypothetical protein
VLSVVDSAVSDEGHDFVEALTEVEHIESRLGGGMANG